MTPRLYLLHGTDEYAGTEFVDELKSRVAPDPGTAALNIALLDGRTVALADIQSACGAMPCTAGCACRRRLPGCGPGFSAALCACWQMPMLSDLSGSTGVKR
ncbi:MAG TPA: hypothetical protein PK954_03600, partial [Anaerolineales bacterium]|nr:hypothetical protein [Anaerolineales bacterium]